MERYTNWNPYTSTEQNIIVERHYLTPQMYRELYLGAPWYPLPYLHQLNHPILASRSNLGIPPHTINTHLASNTVPTARPDIQTARPENQTARPENQAARPENQTAGPDIQTARPENQAPREVRNLINNLINTNTPFQLEVSTLPINRILNQFQNDLRIVRDDENDNEGINLANINNISSVNVFSSMSTSSGPMVSNSNSNAAVEMCSICQSTFEGTDIVRRLNNCGHLFHLNCVDTWLSNHNTCPTCRHNLSNDIPPNRNTNQTGNLADNRPMPTHSNDSGDDTNDDGENSDDAEADYYEQDSNDHYTDDDECNSDCECNCHYEEYTDCDCSSDDEEDNNNDNNQQHQNRNLANQNSGASRQVNQPNYFVITSTGSNTTSNTAPSSTTSQIPRVPTSSNSYSNNQQPTPNNANVHVFTTSGVSSAGANGNPGIAFAEFQSDLNNIINLGTPLLNTIIRTNNTAAQFNSTNINGQFNSMFNAFYPFINAMSDIMGNPNTDNQH